MKIGFLGYEYFGFKKHSNTDPSSAHGGFGFLTRQKAEYLAGIGIDVHVIIPATSYDRDDNENWETEENGVMLHFYKASDKLSEKRISNIYGKFSQHWIKNKNLDNILNSIKIDIFQSEEPGLFTLQSLKYSKRQVIVFQDPYDENDFRIMHRAELEYLNSFNDKMPENIKDLSNFKLKLSLRSRNYMRKILEVVPKDYVFAEANFISEKVKNMYKLSYLPKYLPNPYAISNTFYNKSNTPSIAWIGRFDPQKRPDIALKVATKLPDIDFYFIGKSTEFKPYRDIENKLKEKFSRYDNIIFKEFIAEEEKLEILGKSWVFLNTSAREGLPVSFLEAMRSKTCIVSSVDPDNYATDFGIKVKENDFTNAIKKSMEDEIYIKKGEKGFKHLNETHEITKVMNRHLDIYNILMKS